MSDAPTVDPGELLERARRLAVHDTGDCSKCDLISDLSEALISPRHKVLNGDGTTSLISCEDYERYADSSCARWAERAEKAEAALTSTQARLEAVEAERDRYEELRDEWRQLARDFGAKVQEVVPRLEADLAAATRRGRVDESFVCGQQRQQNSARDGFETVAR